MQERRDGEDRRHNENDFHLRYAPYDRRSGEDRRRTYPDDYEFNSQEQMLIMKGVIRFASEEEILSVHNIKDREEE